jgi:predicted proteasome-type protease
VNLMTYAVAVRLQRGLVFAADTRTNAGIDNVSQFRKLHFWRRTGDRTRTRPKFSGSFALLTTPTATP